MTNPGATHATAVGDESSAPRAVSVDQVGDDVLRATQLFAFDLDDTLAPSKSALPPDMSRELDALLGKAAVCVISGGQIEQFRTQVLSHLTSPPRRLAKLHLMPTCGTQYYRFDDGDWRTVYAETLPESERRRIADVLVDAARSLGYLENDTWGPVTEDRLTQVTFSALGQAAPVDAKKAWDPSGVKRAAIREAAAVRLPGFEVRSGGSTSVDVTVKGIDKAYGVTRLSERTDTAFEQMLFVGDRLDPDGNDFPVLGLGVRCVAVHDWHDTLALLERINRLRAAS